MPSTALTMSHFKPAPWLRSPHVQTLLSSLLTKPLLKKHQAELLNKYHRRLILHTTDYGKLVAHYHQHKPGAEQYQQGNKKLVVLLHGWEGSVESGYIVRTASALLHAGFDVLRLNFRDHGDSHHLNHLPFNSARLLEVEQAIQQALTQLKHSSFHLIGFSLGGNFSLRLAELFSTTGSHQTQPSATLLSTISVCAPIDPVQTSDDIENGPALYHNYFVKRWHRSLKQKYRYYPELIRSVHDLYRDQRFQQRPSLNQMNAVFVPLHTGFDQVNHYLNAYRIEQSHLQAIRCPTLIIYAADDPVIDAKQYQVLSPTDNVSFSKQQYGGHCGFIQNLAMKNWLDDVLLQALDQYQ